MTDIQYILLLIVVVFASAFIAGVNSADVIWKKKYMNLLNKLKEQK